MFQPPSSQHPEPPDWEFEDYALSDGSVLRLKVIRFPGTTKEWVVCDLCSRPIEKSTTGSLTYFRTHRTSKKCKKAQQTKETVDVQREAHSVFESMARVRSENALLNFY
jgi:hypothetical protein